MYYKKISITNYKNFNNIIFDDLKHFNLIVGKTNSGKTNFLEVLSMITTPTHPEGIIKSLSQRGVNFINPFIWKSFFNKPEKNIKLEWELLLPKEKRSLEVQLKKGAEPVPGQAILHEINANGLHLSFSKTDEKNKSSDTLKSSISSTKGKIELTTEEDKTPIDRVFLELNGVVHKDIIGRLDNIIKQRNGDTLLKILKTLEPSLNHLSISPDGLIYADIGLENLVPVNLMGKSFINSLATVITILSCPNSIILIDIADNGLSITNIDFLGTIIFKYAKKYCSQVFMTSSSVDFIKVMNSSFNKVFSTVDDFRVYKLDSNKVTAYDRKKLETALKSDLKVI